MPDKAPEKKKLVVEQACGSGWTGVEGSGVAHTSVQLKLARVQYQNT